MLRAHSPIDNTAHSRFRLHAQVAHTAAAAATIYAIVSIEREQLVAGVAQLGFVAIERVPQRVECFL